MTRYQFDNRFVKTLPADPEPDNFRRTVTGAAYSRVMPRPVKHPELVAVSNQTADLLGFSETYSASDDFLQVFSGNRLMPGMDPFAMCYGGHQFGNWAGQLGDGRAINLGELVSPGKTIQMLQLKGAGPTPYSRNADGFAVLRSSVREFLCSEAMHHLGIPTTRALSLILSGESVERDMFYDGHPRHEPGAIVCRVAPSFTRFGNFELFAARKDTALLKQLADHTIRADFPLLKDPGPETYLQWFEAVCKATCQMIVHWMRVGFVHGVMNTDNMSITGLTIDYGPYGWLEDFNPSWTPNTTDAGMRRYCFGNQPKIALWNLAQLGNAIYPLVGKAQPLQDILDHYDQDYQKKYHAMMAAKLGLTRFDPDQDTRLIHDLTHLLTRAETDMTLFFRALARLDIDSLLDRSINHQAFFRPLEDAWYDTSQITDVYMDQLVQWTTKYARCAARDGLTRQERRRRMNQVNPKYVLRNYLAHQAIEKAETGDFSMIHDLLELLCRPYDAQPEKSIYAQKRPDWAKTTPGCSMLSCSS